MFGSNESYYVYFLYGCLFFFLNIANTPARFVYSKHYYFFLTARKSSVFATNFSSGNYNMNVYVVIFKHMSISIMFKLFCTYCGDCVISLINPKNEISIICFNCFFIQLLNLTITELFSQWLSTRFILVVHKWLQIKMHLF